MNFQERQDKTGWEKELLSLFKLIRDRKIPNVVWITTDVRFAQFAKLDPFGDANPVSYEFISGPLSAVFVKSAELDTTLRPPRIYAEGEIFNFGRICIDAQSHKLTAKIRSAPTDGRRRFGTLVLDPAPAR